MSDAYQIKRNAPTSQAVKICNFLLLWDVSSQLKKAQVNSAVFLCCVAPWGEMVSLGSQSHQALI